MADTAPAKTIAPPPVLFVLCVGVGGTATWLVPVAAPEALRWPGWIVGGGAIALGLALIGWAVRLFLRHRTPFMPNRAAMNLVVVGPYRFTRNPMYVAQVLMAMGAACVFRSPWLAAGAVALCALLDLGVIRPEERHLHERFGDAYAQYRRRVRRWV